MSAPPPASAIPRDIKHHSIALTTKAEASIHYSFVCGQGVIGQTCLVVFLNGLMMPKASWLPVMGSIVRQRKGMGCPSMLAYDRYGQGMTEDRDPQDEGRKEGYGHDCLDAAQDLHQLIVQIADIELQTKLADLQLVFVANSIGCAIARLYAQGYPATVDGILMLDSIMANSNFDFWPNPDAENFKQELLPEDVSIDILREQRAKFAAIFSPSIVNREGLNRRSLAKLLPRSDGPKLLGTKLPPLVTVVGHDFDAFAQESLKTMNTPKSLSMRYSNPVWHAYNEGLTQITDPKRSKGPIIAKGCGHFIQRDDPNFVVQELSAMLDELETDTSN